MELQFEGKIRPSGRAYIVTVPTAFVKGGTLPAGKKFRFLVRPQETAIDLYTLLFCSAARPTAAW